ncbi:MAG: hypothetical protein HYY93_10680 [Planctomycetes bacterium]|nr:hypothetical protein [Planctomycetota bacterium]
MRPELRNYFCGRCGHPCGGFTGFAPDVELGRFCAECTIARIRLSLWIGRLITLAFWVPLAAAALVPAFCIVAMLSAIFSPVVAGLVVLGCVGYGLRRIPDIFEHEQGMVRMIRARNQRPPIEIAEPGARPACPRPTLSRGERGATECLTHSFRIEDPLAPFPDDARRESREPHAPRTEQALLRPVR